MTEPIVVGIDGSVSGTSALRFALAEAARRGRPLRLVYSLSWPPVGATHPNAAGPVVGRVRREAQGALAEAGARARRIAPDVPVSCAIATGAASHVLVEESQRASLVVVGAGRLAGLRLGGTATHVTQHAHCPVVAVPARYREQPGPVLVGVDASESARLATRYAFEAAALRGAELVAIRAWQPPVPHWPHRSVELPDTLMALQAQQRLLLDTAVERWGATFPTVTVQRRLLPGDPAATLLAASPDAALLVVGSRALGPVRGALVGSVAQQILHRARCPIVVVHPHRHAGPERVVREAHQVAAG